MDITKTLEAAPYKTAAVWQLTFHYTNHMLGTFGEARTKMLVTFTNGLLYINTPMLADQQKLSLALCRYWMPSKGLSKR